MDIGLTVKKPDELINVKGMFSESALKLYAYIMSGLKENVYVYNINIGDYLKKFDKRMGDFKKLYKTALELSRKQFRKIDETNREFVIYNLLSRAEYKNGILTVKIDDKFLEYLMSVKKNYLKYDIENIMALNSKYAIRMYEILKNKYEKTKKFQKDIYLKISIKDLKETLRIPESYCFGMLKKRILNKAKSEINEKTDICASFEEIKSGRRTVEIIFTIMPNKKNIRQNASKTDLKAKQKKQNNNIKNTAEKSDTVKNEKTVKENSPDTAEKKMYSSKFKSFLNKTDLQVKIKDFNTVTKSDRAMEFLKKFYDYRIESDAPIKSHRELTMYLDTLIGLYRKGISPEKAVDISFGNGWKRVNTQGVLKIAGNKNNFNNTQNTYNEKNTDISANISSKALEEAKKILGTDLNAELLADVLENGI